MSDYLRIVILTNLYDDFRVHVYVINLGMWNWS